MHFLTVTINRFIGEEPQPGLVECHLIDADGKLHRFVEKTAVVSSAHLFRDTSYPRPGVISCEVEKTWVDENRRAFVRVNTDPWSVESVDGVTTFVVATSQIREETQLS